MKIAKKIWDIFTTVVVVLFVIAAVLLLGSRLIGLEVYNVISGSMEPAYSKGDLIYVKDVDPNTIKENDVITFMANKEGTIATHRVYKVDKENKHLYTKGDANDVPDAKPVHFENVIGVPQFAIPLLGYVSDYISSPPGTYVAIAVVVVLMGIAFIPDMFTKKKSDDGQKPAQQVAPVEAEPAQEPVEAVQQLEPELLNRAVEAENTPGQTNEGGNQL